MRNTLKKFKKLLDDKDRAAKAAIADTVVKTVTEFIGGNKNIPVVVQELKAYSNTKAMDSALKAIRTSSPETSALFLSVDDQEKKIFALCSVPKVTKNNIFLPFNHFN